MGFNLLEIAKLTTNSVSETNKLNLFSGSCWPAAAGVVSMDLPLLASYRWRFAELKRKTFEDDFEYIYGMAMNATPPLCVSGFLD